MKLLLQFLHKVFMSLFILLGLYNSPKNVENDYQPVLFGLVPLSNVLGQFLQLFCMFLFQLASIKLHIVPVHWDSYLFLK